LAIIRLSIAAFPREHRHGNKAGVFQQLAEGEFQIVHGSLKALKRLKR